MKIFVESHYLMVFFMVKPFHIIRNTRQGQQVQHTQGTEVST